MMQWMRKRKTRKKAGIVGENFRTVTQISTAQYQYAVATVCIKLSPEDLLQRLQKMN